MAALKNLTRRPVTFSVTHPDAPRASTPFSQITQSAKTGEFSSKRLLLSLPNTITVLAGETADVPDHAIEDGKRAGLVLVEQKDEPQYGLKQAAKAEPQQPALDAQADEPASRKPRKGTG
jgi:hypothetical protein